MATAELTDFLTRLVRLDRAALVRLRPDGVWAMLPFKVLVHLPSPGQRSDDITVAAADLVEAGERAGRRDREWRWPLPPSTGRPVESIPIDDVLRLAAAAAHTVRTATTEGVGGRAVGERVLRDALLDHVAIVVTADGFERIEIPQRMVQALVRMGLHNRVTRDTIGDGQVTVRLAIRWIGLETRYGSAWYRPISPLHLT